MSKERASFKVTHADCDFTFTKGGGPGGQNVNKRNTKCRCTHRASGATGMSFDERSAEQNKRLAFMRMAGTETFQKWAHLEAARRCGKLAEIEERVAHQMRPQCLQLQVKDEHGLWQDAPLNSSLDDTPPRS